MIKICAGRAQVEVDPWQDKDAKSQTRTLNNGSHNSQEQNTKSGNVVRDN